MLSLVLLFGLRGLQDPAPDATAANLRARVQWLASDQLEGRQAGTRSADQAADYLVKALAADGLQPCGDNGSWSQSFELEMPAEPGACWLDLGAQGRRDGLRTLELSASKTVSGPLLDLGYGVDEYRGRNANGALVLVRRYTTAGPEAGGEAARGGDLRSKVRAAAEAGALGLILGTDPEDMARGGAAEIPFDAAPGTGAIPVVIVDPSDFGMLETLAAAGPRSITLSAEVRHPKAVTRNVLACLPGKSDEVLVLGAHYDHLGYGGRDSLAPGVHEIHNGADDNASGTALVLELAHTLAAGPQPERTLLFALWSGEEEGLLGSEYWCQHPTLARERVVANLNFDMVGRLDSGRITVGAADTAAAFAPALQRHAPASGLEYAVASAATPGVGGSDHMSFHQAGIPALFFFSGMHTDYHRPSDDWDKLDYARMGLLEQAVAPLVLDLAAQPRSAFAYVAPPAQDPHQGLSLGDGEHASMGTLPDYGASPAGGGMQIAGVSPGGAAEKAGLKSGDVIRKVGEVAVGDIYDFMDALGRYRPGQTVDVVILRDGTERTLPVTLGGRRAAQ